MFLKNCIHSTRILCQISTSDFSTCVTFFLHYVWSVTLAEFVYLMFERFIERALVRHIVSHTLRYKLDIWKSDTLIL